LKAIETYRSKHATKGRAVKVQGITPPYIESLNPAKGLGYSDIFYHPKQLRDSSNDNSTIKFFRGGAFNVLSLGDVEDPAIAAMLKRCKTLCREVDVMILAHHGADNGFTTKDLLEKLKPQVAICSSNYSNQFDHPRQEIRELLFEQEIRLFTTKTGDITIHSTGSHTRDFRVRNYIRDGDKLSSEYDYKARKHHWLSMNADSRRNLLHPGFKGLR
jgi:competence protein ComEC